MKLNEVRKEDDLYFKGPFWIVADSIKDLRLGKYKIVGEKYLCDFNGNFVSDNAPSRSMMTHKKLWRDKYANELNCNDKPYNYYPRGRVEVWDGQAYIFVHSSMNFEPLIGNLIHEYGLDKLDDESLVEVVENDYQGSHYDYLLK